VPARGKISTRENQKKEKKQKQKSFCFFFFFFFFFFFLSQPPPPPKEQNRQSTDRKARATCQRLNGRAEHPFYRVHKPHFLKFFLFTRPGKKKDAGIRLWTRTVASPGSACAATSRPRRGARARRPAAPGPASDPLRPGLPRSPAASVAPPRRRQEGCLASFSRCRNP
jgi:hypothetical protein